MERCPACRGVTMSSIGTKLLNSLRSVERSGDFCVGGIREIFMPTIDVGGALPQVWKRLANAQQNQSEEERVGAPWGTRTPVFAVRGRRPGPLDEGSLKAPR